MSHPRQSAELGPLRVDAAVAPVTATELHRSASKNQALTGWRRQVQVATVGGSVGAIAVFGSLMIGSYQEASAATSVSTVALPAAAPAHGSPSPTSPGGMPGMDSGYGKTAASDRPLASVLGTFTGGTSVVLLTAVLLRRRDRAARAAREAARATVMSQK